LITRPGRYLPIVAGGRAAACARRVPNLKAQASQSEIRFTSQRMSSYVGREIRPPPEMTTASTPLRLAIHSLRFRSELAAKVRMGDLD